MQQLDLFYDRYKRYIITNQKDNNKLWVIWDDKESKETPYIFTTGKKAVECLNNTLTQEWYYA